MRGRAVLQRLRAFDLSAFPSPLQDSRPRTALYKELEGLSMPFIALFLSAVANSEHPELPTKETRFRVRPGDLYEAAKAFSDEGGYEYRKHITRFAADVLSIIGQDNRRYTASGGSAIYEMDRASLRTRLMQKSQMYDQDVMLPARVRLKIEMPPKGSKTNHYGGADDAAAAGGGGGL